jgi:large subunit ribosomal protein L10
MAGFEKTLMLKEVKNKLKDRKNIFLTRVNKITVDDFNKLRQTLSDISDNAFVVKNSVARIAFDELGLKEGVGSIDGTVFIVVGDREPQKISKELVDFGSKKEAEQFEIRGAFIEGGYAAGDAYVKQLAKLPSKEVLVATLLGTMKSPITNFVFVLNGLIRSLAIALHEVSKKKSEQN